MSRTFPYYIIGISVIFFTWWALSIIVNSYVVPSPFVVLNSIIFSYKIHWKNFTNTGIISFLGLLMSFFISIFSLTINSIYPKIEKISYPIIILFKASPAIALAPIIISISGTGLISKSIISCLICFFPLIIGGMDGIRRTPNSLIELSNIYNASNVKLLKNIYFGYLLNGLLSGLKTSAPLSVVGAIVAEYIIGGNHFGLGSFIISNIHSSSNINMYAGAVLSTFLGMVFFLLSIYIYNYYEKKLFINY